MEFRKIDSYLTSDEDEATARATPYRSIYPSILPAVETRTSSRELAFWMRSRARALESRRMKPLLCRKSLHLHLHRP